MSVKPSREQPGMDEERPKIYVTPRGAMYVKADELLRSKRARAQIDAMAKLDLKKAATITPSKDST